jgi:hypothetical protein
MILKLMNNGEPSLRLMTVLISLAIVIIVLLFNIYPIINVMMVTNWMMLLINASLLPRPHLHYMNLSFMMLMKLKLMRLRLITYQNHLIYS